MHDSVCHSGTSPFCVYCNSGGCYISSTALDDEAALDVGKYKGRVVSVSVWPFQCGFLIYEIGLLGSRLSGELQQVPCCTRYMGQVI